MATRLNPTTFGYQNFYSATLTADITSGTLVIGVSAVPTPDAGILVIEPDSTTNREVILYTSKGASTITCPSDGRGYSGTTPASHLQGSSVIMAPVDKWFTALASGELSSDPIRTDHFRDYVVSGGIWTADSAGSTLAASMTSGVVYISGRRLTLTAVTARAFTASKDTYIDVSDNSDGTGLLTYTEVANNAASPALAANSIRLGTVVTAAGSIAASTAIGQGGFANITPVISSQIFKGFDSRGNLIYPKGPATPVLLQNPYKFSVYLSANQTGLADTASVKAAFDRKNFDTGNNFDTTLYRFTAPVAGYYQINAYVSITSSGNNGVAASLFLYKNGVNLNSGGGFYPTVGAGNSPTMTGNISQFVQLAAGDYLEIYATADVVSGTWAITTASYFSGFLVSTS